MNDRISAPPQYVQAWASAARTDGDLLASIKHRYWEKASSREQLRKRDLALVVQALDRMLNDQSAMVRRGGWRALEELSGRAGPSEDDRRDAVIYWVKGAVLLPVLWDHLPGLPRSKLRGALAKVAKAAHALQHQMRRQGKHLAYWQPNLFTVDGLRLLHRLKKENEDPPFSISLFPVSVEDSEETLDDLLNVLRTVTTTPTTERGVGHSAMPSHAKLGKKFPRRGFFIRALVQHSEVVEIAPDPFLIWACVHDLLASVADDDALHEFTPSYVRKLLTT